LLFRLFAHRNSAVTSKLSKSFWPFLTTNFFNWSANVEAFFILTKFIF
jgi:hypothetical protein